MPSLSRLVAIGAALAALIAFSTSPVGAAGALAGAAAGEPPVRNLSHLGSLSRYAFIERPVTVRARPSFSAGRLTRLRTRTYWGTSALVPALALTSDPAGRSWTKVRLPMPPNNRLGWVPSRALSGLRGVRTWLRIDRQHFRISLVRNERVVFRAPIGVGLPKWPTPAGQFVIEQRITPIDRNTVYGVLAFGTSAHSNVLREWPNEGQVGIHGTNEPWLIPGRISHGCVRLRNRDIRRLGRLMPVGTPLTIR